MFCWLLKEPFVCYLQCKVECSTYRIFTSECNAERELLKNCFVTDQGGGATRSSVPHLQNCCISLKMYSFLSQLNPSGFNIDGSMDAGGRFSRFFSSILNCSGEVKNSFK